jgi:hypothetical protein
VKAVFASVIALSLLAAGAAEARPHHMKPHKVCVMKHHHRVCHWVR